MKIALISAGHSIHTRRWAEAFAERGHEVHVIFCSNHSYDYCGAYNGKIIGKKLCFPAPFGYYLNAYELKSYIRKENFDVVNVHYASGYGTLGRLAGQKHALLNIWGSDVYEFPYQSKFNLKTVRKNLTYYDYLASTSNCMAEQAKKVVDVDKKIYITPFGVDTEKFKPVIVEKKKGYVVGTVKTLDPKYGIDISIKAFAKLLQMLAENGKKDIADNITYEIYGKGDEKDNLVSLAKELGVADKVRFMGYVDNVKLPVVINTFNIFCCTSRQESFGVAVVEAMACGVPAVTSDVDGFKEVMENNKTGYIVERENVDEAATALFDLLIDDEKRTACGQYARERVLKLFDWNKNVDTMLSIYEEMKK